MARAQGNRLPYLVMGTGVLFVWAGWSNKSVLDTLKDVISGKQPTPGPGFHPFGANVIAGTGTPDPTIGTPSDMQAEAKKMLAKHGWQNQWSSFNSLEMGEAGYDATAENETTGFFGVAQAGNHGTAHSASPSRKHLFGQHKGQPVNNYGGYGLSDSEAQSANGGDGVMQLQWMGNYIASQYGDPNHAYMKWLSRNPHWY